MENEMANDPFATTEIEVVAVRIGSKAQAGRTRQMPEQTADADADPLATNKLPEVADPVRQRSESGTVVTQRYC